MLCPEINERLEGEREKKRKEGDEDVKKTEHPSFIYVLFGALIGE
jgi:hypothetical protein